MRRRLSYANVVSSLALFIALGGVSWAAATLPRNSVGRTQLKTGAVTGAKVRNGTVTTRDLAKSVRTALAKAGTAGPAGPTGPAGPKGDTGPATAAKFGRIVTAESAPQTVTTGGTIATAECPAGTRLLSGGGATSRYDLQLTSSMPVGGDDPHGWSVQTVLTGGGSATLTAYALCLTAG